MPRPSAPASASARAIGTDTARRPRVFSQRIADPGDLTAFLPAETSAAWLRRGDGMVGIGEALRFQCDSMTEADAWWSDVVAGVDVASDLPLEHGVGPLAFGSFAFDPGHTAMRSVLIVPRLVVGRRSGVAWVTGWDVTPELPAAPAAPLPPVGVAFADGALAAPEWEGAVAEAVRRLSAGELDKVVLARDLMARAASEIDYRWLVARLADEYPSTWAYSVDGLVGATPEMLVRREGGLATSRVLAGTIRRRGAEADVVALAESLARSNKDLSEHRYAVESVAHALAPFCAGMNVPEEPYVLKLPNVMHLASDVTGVCADGASSLALAAALHPSAAVCGTPTDDARLVIRELEHMDRGRYAGPVGWIDAAGDGEWGIALRCGVLGPDPHEVRLFAGCGIVAESDPASELAEANAKLIPMRDALADA